MSSRSRHHNGARGGVDESLRVPQICYTSQSQELSPREDVHDSVKSRRRLQGIHTFQCSVTSHHAIKNANKVGKQLDEDPKPPQSSSRISLKGST
jgi:hypothetical protein